jgi:hypothetical protein
LHQLQQPKVHNFPHFPYFYPTRCFLIVQSDTAVRNVDRVPEERLSEDKQGLSDPKPHAFIRRLRSHFYSQTLGRTHRTERARNLESNHRPLTKITKCVFHESDRRNNCLLYRWFSKNSWPRKLKCQTWIRSWYPFGNLQSFVRRIHRNQDSKLKLQ